MHSADAFGSFHPLVGFLYFGLVFAFSMVLMHPVCLAVSLGCALAYLLWLKKGRAARFGLLYLLPLMFGTALLNPAFSHEGATILTYLPSGNPLTLESVLYGLAAAAVFASVACWFGCYTELMTSDKFVYLFGRISPAFSLVLSMTLRFVPRFRAQLRTVSGAREGIGRAAGSGGILTRAKNAPAVFSILLTWALENAADTAESMKSRGYGLAGRTAFSVYRFDGRDRAALFWLLFCGGYVALGAVFGAAAWRYFPTVRFAAGAAPASVFLGYFALCATPLAIDIWEDKKWNALRSAI